MAVGIIRKCEKCGATWDEGKTQHWACNPHDAELKRQRESWPTMTVEEKCEWLKAEIERVRNEIPFSGPIH